MPRRPNSPKWYMAADDNKQAPITVIKRITSTTNSPPAPRVQLKICNSPHVQRPLAVLACELVADHDGLHSCWVNGKIYYWR